MKEAVAEIPHEAAVAKGFFGDLARRARLRAAKAAAHVGNKAASIAPVSRSGSKKKASSVLDISGRKKRCIIAPVHDKGIRMQIYLFFLL